MDKNAQQIRFSKKVAAQFYTEKEKIIRDYVSIGGRKESIGNNEVMIRLLGNYEVNKLKKEIAQLKQNMLSMLDDRKKIQEFINKINLDNGQKLIIEIDNIPGLRNRFGADKNE